MLSSPTMEHKKRGPKQYNYLVIERPWHPHAAVRIERQIRALTYDSEVKLGQFRVRYAHLLNGLPFYAVYKGRRLLGIIDIRHFDQVPRIQRQLAAYLAAAGASPEQAQRVEFRPYKSWYKSRYMKRVEVVTLRQYHERIAAS